MKIGKLYKYTAPEYLSKPYWRFISSVEIEKKFPTNIANIEVEGLLEKSFLLLIDIDTPIKSDIASTAEIEERRINKKLTFLCNDKLLSSIFSRREMNELFEEVK